MSASGELQTLGVRFAASDFEDRSWDKHNLRAYRFARFASRRWWRMLAGIFRVAGLPYVERESSTTRAVCAFDQALRQMRKLTLDHWRFR